MTAITLWFKETRRQNTDLAIFGFFRVYPMYLVDRFHMSVGRVSEFIAWVAVPIVFANVWLVGALSKRLRP